MTEATTTTPPSNPLIQSISQTLALVIGTATDSSATWALQFESDPTAQISVAVTVNSSDSTTGNNVYSALLSNDDLSQISQWLGQQSAQIPPSSSNN